MTHGTAHMPFFQYINDAGMFVFSLLMAFGLGRVLHELTHVLVANLLGHSVENIELNPLNGQVAYQTKEGTPLWHVRVIGMAPLLVGSVTLIAFLWLFWGNWPNLMGLYVVGTGWFAYTLLGSAADYSINAARDNGHLWNPSRGERLLVLALGLIVMGFLTQNIHLLGDYAISTTMGLILAAFGVMAMGLKEIKAEET